ncbi:transmembrane protein 160-like [Argopecten irradians]|uniref:transmembrane protein 160-like n=1 Tax=Argopecten irradians TaxID=31199 RepID=UPI0037230913
MALLRKCLTVLTKTSKIGNHFTCLSGGGSSLPPSASLTSWSRIGIVTGGKKISLLLRPTQTVCLPKTFTHKSHKKEAGDATAEKLADSTLNCRLAAENGFLSWTRNGYISCVAACALLTHVQTEAMVDAVFGVFLISYMNMSCGTAVYLWNLLSMRKRVQMSSATALLYITLVLAHFLVYTVAMVVFLNDFDSSKIEGLEREESDIRKF